MLTKTTDSEFVGMKTEDFINDQYVSALVDYYFEYFCDPQQQEDQKQTFWLNMLRLKNLERFDPKRSSFKTYLIYLIKYSIGDENKKELKRKKLFRRLKQTPLPTKEVIDLELAETAMASFEEYLSRVSPLTSRAKKDFKYRGVLNHLACKRLSEQKNVPVLFNYSKKRTLAKIVTPDSRVGIVPAGELSKVTLNPVYGFKPANLIHLSGLDFFKMLKDGFDSTAVACRYGISNSTVHNWIQTLEQYFLDWFSKSDLIDAQLRSLASTYVCEGCGAFHLALPDPSERKCIERIRNRTKYLFCSPNGVMRTGQWCHCGSSLDKVRRGSGLIKRCGKLYPWSGPRASSKKQCTTSS